MRKIINHNMQNTDLFTPVLQISISDFKISNFENKNVIQRTSDFFFLHSNNCSFLLLQNREMLFLQPSSKCLLPTEARLTSLTFQSTLPLVTSSTSGPLLVVFGVLVKNAGSFGHFSTYFLALTYFLCFTDLQCVSISN